MVYTDEIAKYKPLTRAEESVLVARIKNGDIAARNKLIKHNLKFVVLVCKKFKGRGLKMPDLIGYGNLGLTIAANSFDETSGYKFISYAVWFIRSVILDALSENSHILNPTWYRFKIARDLKKAISKIEGELGRPATPAEIAERLEMDEDNVTDVLQKSEQPMPIEKFIFPDDKFDSPDNDASKELVKKRVVEAMKKLTPQEESVIGLFYGIGINTSFSASEIGEQMGFSASWVCGIRRRAIKKLKRYLKNEFSNGVV